MDVFAIVLRTVMLILPAPVAAQDSPLSCLLTAPLGLLQVELLSQGCFGDHQGNWLQLKWNATSGTRTGMLDRPHKSKNVDAPLTLVGVRAILHRIFAATVRAESASECGSTTWKLATLRWSCGGTVEVLSFSSEDCGSSAEPGAYARAIGLSHIVRDVLEAVPQR